MKAFVFVALFFFSCIDRADPIEIDNLDNATVVITEGNDNFYLGICEVKRQNDSIVINLTDTSKLSNGYEIQIKKSNKQLSSICRNTFLPTDSSYKSPIFRTIY